MWLFFWLVGLLFGFPFFPITIKDLWVDCVGIMESWLSHPFPYQCVLSYSLWLRVPLHVTPFNTVFCNAGSVVVNSLTLCLYWHVIIFLYNLKCSLTRFGNLGWQLLLSGLEITHLCFLSFWSCWQDIWCYSDISTFGGDLAFPPYSF